MHSRGIIAIVQHCRSNVRQELLLYGELVKPGKKRECLILRNTGYEFCERLSRQSHSLHFVPRRFEFGLYSPQDDESIGYFLLVRLGA